MDSPRKQRVKSIETISIWNIIKIFIYSIIYGTMFFFNLIAKWAWRPKTFFCLQKRDRPPPFLVDSSFGQHYYVKLNGVKFHYVEHGLRSKPVILLLHGFPDCWISWRHQIPLLSKHFRVVALDLKGFGDSDKPSQRHCYRVKVLLNELHEFINSLGVSSCIIIGHDLGALLGWLLIYTYPGLVTKFVALSCPHPNIYWDSLPQNGNFSQRWVHFSQLPYLPEVECLKEDLSVITQYYNHVNGNGEKMSVIEAYKYSFSRSEDWTGPINYYRNLPFIRISEGANGSSWGSEPWKGGQVLLMSGGQDSYTSLESVIHSLEFLPKDAHATVRVIPGAGHLPHQENPDVVNSYLLNFLHVPCEEEEKEKLSQANGGEGIHKRLVNRVLESSWLRYGNQVLGAAKKGAVSVGLTHDENNGRVISLLGSNGLVHS